MMKCSVLLLCLLSVQVTEVAAKFIGDVLPIPHEQRVFKRINDTELKFHIFYPPNHDINTRKPAIIFFFGGGWSGGNPRQFYFQSEYFASRGIVAISAEYRTKRYHGTSPQESVKDAKSAIRWLKVNAGELGVDPSKIVAAGGSAGGHIAAAAATLSKFNDVNENTDISTIPHSLVLFNPVIDNGPKGYGYKRVKNYWQDFSPLHNVNDKIPPTILFFGTQDKFVPVATAQAFQKKIQDQGQRCELIIYEGQPHGFFNRARYHETLLEADKFLVSLGILKEK